MSSRASSGPIGEGASETAQTKSARRGEPPQSPCTLIVGADEPSLRLCDAVLREAGFRVEQVDSGIAAVVVARRSRPKIIVIDEQLRDVSSHEAVSWLRSNPDLGTTAIYVLTTHRDHAKLPPGSNLLQKPVGVRAVREIIAKLAPANDPS